MVLLVEDHPEFAAAILAGLARRGEDATLLSRVDAIGAGTIRGHDILQDQSVTVDLRQISRAYVDHELPGEYNGGDVVQALSTYSNAWITGISSVKTFNLRMQRMGARDWMLKRDFLRTL
jgi:hypothetical protein